MVRFFHFSIFITCLPSYFVSRDEDEIASMGIGKLFCRELFFSSPFLLLLCCSYLFVCKGYMSLDVALRQMKESERVLGRPITFLGVHGHFLFQKPSPSFPIFFYFFDELAGDGENDSTRPRGVPLPA